MAYQNPPIPYGQKPRAIRDKATGLFLAKPAEAFRTPGEVLEWTSEPAKAVRFKPSVAQDQQRFVSWHHSVNAAIVVLEE
jgi:hypothetical protein